MEGIDGTAAEELHGAIECNVKSLVYTVFGDKDNMEDVLKKLTRKGGPIDKNDILYNSLTKTWNNWPQTNKKGTEKQLAQHLNNIADHIRRELGLSLEEDDRVFSSG